MLQGFNCYTGASEGDRAMDDNATTTATSERPRTGQPVANPRRLRLGRDGRPLPQAPRDVSARPTA